MKNEIITTFSFDIIPYGKAFLKTEFVITINVWKEENFFLTSFPLFGIELCEDSLEDLQLAFEEEIAFLWDEYVLAPDEKLNKDAIALKRILKQYFTVCTIDEFYPLSSSRNYTYTPYCYSEVNYEFS